MQRATYLPIQQGGLYQAPCCTPTCVRKPLFRPAWLSKKRLDTRSRPRADSFPAKASPLLNFHSHRRDGNRSRGSWIYHLLTVKVLGIQIRAKLNEWFHSIQQRRAEDGNVQCLSSCTLSLELTWQRTTVGGTNSTESCVAASERTKEHKLFH
jgi:hypothetical protein